MPRYPVEEALLREPNLWVPGKKPVGPVKIDWSHPSTVGLLQVFFPVSNGYFSYTKNDVGADTRGSLSVSDAGIGRFYSDRTSAGRYKELNVYQSSAWEVFSGLVGFKVTGAATDDHGFITFNDDITSAWSLLFWADTFGSALRPALSIAFNSNTSSTTGYGTNGSIKVDKTHVLGATWRRNDYFNFVLDGGVQAPTAAGTEQLNTFDSWGDHVRLYDRSSWSEFQGLQGNANFAMYWHRQLSNAEMVSLTLDPYQFLIPA